MHVQIIENFWEGNETSDSGSPHTMYALLDGDGESGKTLDTILVNEPNAREELVDLLLDRNNIHAKVLIFIC